MSVVAATTSSTGAADAVGVTGATDGRAHAATAVSVPAACRNRIPIRRSYSAAGGPGSGLWLSRLARPDTLGPTSSRPIHDRDAGPLHLLGKLRDLSSHDDGPVLTRCRRSH